MAAMYQVDGALLHISGEMNEVIDIAFDLSISELLDAKVDALTIDMKGVQYVSSIYLGRMVAACRDARKRGKKLLIVAPETVADVLEVAGIHELIHVERC